MRASAAAGGLVLLAGAATAWEGGASPHGILLVHGLLAALAVLWILAPPPAARALPPSTRGALVLFAAAVAVSAWRASYGFAAVLVVQDVIVGLAVLAMAARLPQAGGMAARCALAAVAAAQGGIAVAQALSGSERAAGSFLNPNHLAAWTVAVGLWALPPMVSAGGRARGAAWVLGAGALAALLASRSRGAALGLVAGAAALLVLRWPALRAGARRAALVVALSAALLAGGLFAWRLQEEDPYRWTRTRIWSAALDVATASPWLGCGPGQFPLAAARARFQDPVGPLHWERRFSTPHSDWLRLPAEFGLLAALAAGFAGASALRAPVRRARAGEGLHAAASLAALAALAAQSAVDDLTTRPALVVLGALLLGSAAGIERERPAAPLLGRGWPRPAAALIVLVAFSAGDLATWLAWRERDPARAVAWNPIHPNLHLRLAERRLRAGLGDADAYADARAEAEAAVRLSPRDARYRVGLARVEGAACRTLFPDEGTRARAAAHYAQAQRLAPFDVRIPLEEGRFLLATGDLAGARKAAERGCALEPEAVPPRLLLARVLLASGDPGAAAALAEAEERARRHAFHPKESGYARAMLAGDPAEMEALRRALPGS